MSVTNIFTSGTPNNKLFFDFTSQRGSKQYVYNTLVALQSIR